MLMAYRRNFPVLANVKQEAYVNEEIKLK
jgi:hypothetical protein